MASLTFLMLMLSVYSTGTKGSYCMSTDCINTGSYQHGGGLGLYLRACCNISNLGQSVTISEPGINRYMLCPKVLPKSCPKEPQKSIQGTLDCNQVRVHTQQEEVMVQ